MRGLAAVLAAVIVGAAATTVSPTQHNFGRWAVNATSPRVSFRVTLPAGSAITDSITVSIIGPDAGDFGLSDRRLVAQTSMRVECGLGGGLFSPPTPGACDIPVEFMPRSLGQKTAQLQVVDRAGTTTTARLTGEGIAPLCTMTAVWCNYAHLYTGTFSWTVNLRGTEGSTQTSVEVTVTNGEAWCTGTEVNTGPAGPWQGTITGPGIIGVEFVPDPVYTLAYEITVACPSAKFPDHPDGSKGRASEPAELGNSYSITTHKQAARVAGEDLTGGLTYPAPESDPINGVTGSVGITWSLLRRPPPPPPPPSPP